MWIDKLYHSMRSIDLQPCALYAVQYKEIMLPFHFMFFIVLCRLSRNWLLSWEENFYNLLHSFIKIHFLYKPPCSWFCLIMLKILIYPWLKWSIKAQILRKCLCLILYFSSEESRWYLFIKLKLKKCQQTFKNPWLWSCINRYDVVISLIQRKYIKSWHTTKFIQIFSMPVIKRLYM